MVLLIYKIDEYMTAKQLADLIATVGWYYEREGKGSHKIYKHPDFPYPISIPFHGKKELGKGLVSKLKKQAGLR